MFSPNSVYRFEAISRIPSGTTTDYRSEYGRDYARVLHSPSFRRLQNKTQLFPGHESDFFRNRLTHSLEVSQIAKSIATKLKEECPSLPVIPEVCEIAGLIHDIGHPPFGHNGEAALDECMRKEGGFEGNAQTLRVITRLEKKEKPSAVINAKGQDQRIGLNLTARVIASALKYDTEIPITRTPADGLVKGYYASESKIVNKVKECLVENPSKLKKPFKTIECAIMDIADDIAYSTYDVEDAFKADFLTPYDLIAVDPDVLVKVGKGLVADGILDPTDDKKLAGQCRKHLLDIFSEIWELPIDKQKKVRKDRYFEVNTLETVIDIYRRSKRLADDGYWRTKLTSSIVNDFINGVHVAYDADNPILSTVYLDKGICLDVALLKRLTFELLINSSRLKVVESRGGDIVKQIFESLNSEKGYSLLPEDTKKLFGLADNLPIKSAWRARVICDFIAGMTDRYALEFYSRLFSENPQTIFKPI